MKIKKHLVAATLAVGLVGSAGAYAPAGGSTHAQVGYVVAYHFLNNSGIGQAAAQGGGAGAGGLFGMWAGKKIGKRSPP